METSEERVMFCVTFVYSCFDKGCPTKVKKRMRQCRLALWVVRVWLCLMIEVHCDSATRKEKVRIRVCAVSFHHAVTPWRSLKAAVKTAITHNDFRHCRVSFSPFVKQPFSKQLYTDSVQTLGRCVVWPIVSAALSSYAGKVRSR